MSYRYRALIALLATLALLAAACGGSSFEEPAAEDDAADEGVTDDEAGTGEGTDGEQAAGGASLQLMGASSGPAEDAALQAIVDAYSEETGNEVTLNFVPEYDTALQAALAGGQPPDVFYVDSNRLPDLVEAGVLAPAEGQIEDPDDFYPSLVTSFTYDGQFWCPPKDFSTLALQYNVAALEEAALEPPTTWEELRAAAEALTTDDRAGLALAAEYPRWGAFLFQADAAVTNEDFTEMVLDSDGAREALTYLEEMYANGWAATATDLDAGWPGEAFGLERAAMTIEGNWMVGAMRDGYPDLDWATAPLPAGPAGEGTFAFTVCYAVPANAADADASWDLVNYLVSPDKQLEYTSQFPVMPSRQSLADEWLEANPGLDAYLEGAEYARPFQFVPGFQGVLDTLNSGIQGIAAGNEEVDAVIDRTTEVGDPALGG